MERRDLIELLDLAEAQLERIAHRVVHLDANNSWRECRDLATAVRRQMAVVRRVREGIIGAATPVAAELQPERDEVALSALVVGLEGFTQQLGSLLGEVPMA